jgi:hypothetical protein
MEDRMSEPIPETIVDDELVLLIENAAEKALKKLFDEHDEKFYYITLATFGECVCPVLSAWSVEALEREANIKGYSEEEKAAYLYACENDITTIRDIEDARL